MVDYSKSKIFKIVDNVSYKQVVLCSTKKYISSVYSSYLMQYEKYKNKSLNKNIKDELKEVFLILKNKNCSCVLIENYPCNSVDELKARKRTWIDSLDCINNIKISEPLINVIKTKKQTNRHLRDNTNMLDNPKFLIKFD